MTTTDDRGTTDGKLTLAEVLERSRMPLAGACDPRGGTRMRLHHDALTKLLLLAVFAGVSLGIVLLRLPLDSTALVALLLLLRPHLGHGSVVALLLGLLLSSAVAAALAWSRIARLFGMQALAEDIHARR